MRKPIDVEQEYYCDGCDIFEPEIVKYYADGRVVFQYIFCKHAEKCRRLHEHIQHRTNFELDKAKKRITELENELNKCDHWWGD